MPYIYICIKMKKKIRSREELGKMNSHFKPRSPIKYFLSPLLVIKKKKKKHYLIQFLIVVFGVGQERGKTESQFLSTQLFHSASSPRILKWL